MNIRWKQACAACRGGLPISDAEHTRAESRRMSPPLAPPMPRCVPDRRSRGRGVVEPAEMRCRHVIRFVRRRSGGTGGATPWGIAGSARRAKASPLLALLSVQHGGPAGSAPAEADHERQGEGRLGESREDRCASASRSSDILWHVACRAGPHHRTRLPGPK
jgi:hypothetical protein